MNIVKSIILFIISAILVACVVFLFNKISVWEQEQLAFAFIGILITGVGAIMCFGLGIAYLISDEWR